jgi:hypothetical protein
MAVGSQSLAPADLPPGQETRYPSYRKMEWHQGLPERVRKISLQPGFDRPTFQPAASRYTDWAILAHKFCAYFTSKYGNHRDTVVLATESKR